MKRSILIVLFIAIVLWAHLAAAIEPGPNEGDVVSIPMLSGVLTGLAIEAGGTTALVTEGSREISRVDLTTGLVTTITRVDTDLPNETGGYIQALAIEPGGASVLVAANIGFLDAQGNASRKLSLYRVNLGTGDVIDITEQGLNVLPSAIEVEPGGGSALFLSIGASGGLFRVDLDSGAVTQIAAIAGYDVALEPGGATALFVSQCDVNRVNVTTGVVTTVASLSSLCPASARLSSVAVEPGGASALVNTSSRVYRVNLGTGVFAQLTPCTQCNLTHITTDPTGNAAFFLEDGTFVPWLLTRLDLSTFEKTAVAVAESPFDIAIPPANASAYITTGNNVRFDRRVSRVDLTDGFVEHIGRLANLSGGIVCGSYGGCLGPTGIALNAAGTTAYATSTQRNPIQGVIQEVVLDTGVVSTIAASLTSGTLSSIALEGQGGTALLTSHGDDGLVRAILEGPNVGDLTVLVDQLTRPSSVIVEEDGVSALVTTRDNNGSLYRVDLQTNTAVEPPIATNLGSGTLGLALEPGGESVLVTSGQMLLRVDLVTGSVTTITDRVCGYPQSGSATNVAVEDGGNTALVVHHQCGILRVRVMEEADSDGDGVPDSEDVCPGFDDGVDSDGDGVPEGCDVCAGDDATGDTDGDGVCDDLDLCVGNDASGDTDADGLCDSQDPCIGASNTDSDGDGVCDGGDLCFGDDATGDSDGDGICDSSDACPLGDDNADADGDGTADACDACPIDPNNDSDGDGVCDSDDACSSGDDNVDTDGDGTADACDVCPVDPENDADGDSYCESVDNCPDIANGDQADSDGDSIGDVCDSAHPQLSVIPNLLAFDSILVGNSIDIELTVQNLGDQTLNGTCSIDAPFSLPDGCTYSVLPGQAQQVRMRFTPTTEISFMDTVDFESNGGNTSLEVTGFGKLELYDLSILNIVPIQVVDGLDIDADGQVDLALILDKPMAVRLEIHIDDDGALPDEQLVAIQLIFQGNEFNQEITIQELRGNNFLVEFLTPNLTPRVLGETSIIARIDPGNLIQETNEDNNQREVGVIIKEASGLYVAYMRVDCFGPLSSYVDTVNQAGEFLKAVYPMAPSNFTNQLLDVSIECTDNLGGDFDNLWQQFDNLWLQGKLLTSGAAERVIGIVDSNWMSERELNAAGVSWCGGNSAFVLEGHWEAVAHEIGHTFQFSHPSDPENDRCDLSPGVGSTDGFWVEEEKPIIGAYPLMETTSRIPPDFPDTQHWITRDNYKRVFENDFRINAVDPEILLVSGILYRDGRIRFSPFYRLPNGIVDKSRPGNFSIQVLDSEENVLHTTAFPVKFLLTTHPPINVDAIPFGFAVPYPTEATVVQIQQNGQVLAHVGPAGAFEQKQTVLTFTRAQPRKFNLPGAIYPR